jgi:putative Holliday junction resolvase
VDYGARRIGLALTDPTETIAAPLTTLVRRTGKRPPWAELERLVQTHGVARIVVGLPLNLAGGENDWTVEVRAFADKLAERTGLPVELEDERLSSVEAERTVRGMGLRKNQREEKGRIDSTAAAMILRSYLDRQPRG